MNINIDAVIVESAIYIIVAFIAGFLLRDEELKKIKRVILILYILFYRYITFLKYSTVFLIPLSISTLGLYPSLVFASVKSGFLCIGSSLGSSTNLILDFDPVSRKTKSAKSDIVNS